MIVVSSASFVFPSDILGLKLKKLAIWKQQWMQTETVPEKACSFYPKDQEGGSLASFQIITTRPQPNNTREKSVACTSTSKARVGSLDFQPSKDVTKFSDARPMVMLENARWGTGTLILAGQKQGGYQWRPSGEPGILHQQCSSKAPLSLTPGTVSENAQ